MSPPPGPAATTGPDLALVLLDDDGQPFLVLSDQPAAPAGPPDTGPPDTGPPDAGATVATEATGDRR